MVVNFRTREISWNTRKLTRTLILIKKKFRRLASCEFKLFKEKSMQYQCVDQCVWFVVMACNNIGERYWYEFDIKTFEVSEFGSCKLTTFTWIMFPLIYFNHWTIGPHFLFMMLTPGTIIILFHLFQTLCTFRLSMANRAALNDYDFDIGFYRVKDRIELTLFSAIFLFIVYWF